MIFLSILTKTCAIALAPFHQAGAALFWGLGMILDALIFRKASGEGGVSKAIWPIVAFNVAALVIGWAAAAACDYAAMRWKLGIPLVSHLLAGFLQLVGVPAAAHGGQLSLTTMAGPLEMAASIDQLGLRVPIIFLALSTVWLCGVKSKLSQVLRNFGIITGVLLAVAIVRTGLVALLFLGLSEFVGYDTEELPFRPFAEEAVLIWTYLPFLLVVGILLGRLLPRPVLAARAPIALPRAMRWGALPLLLLVFGFLLWEPTGTPKTGKIVISTFHTQWSRTDRPYDREWYGADSGYNYAGMKRLFEVFYPVVETRARLTMDDLKDASILVLYVPDQRFSQDEIQLVHEFVRGGGGLLVIGDHTNVFGSTSHLNEVCEPLGFQYRDDVLFDLDEDFHQTIDRPQRPSQFWHGMAMFKLRGPCSIRPTSLATRPIYQVGHSKSVRAIYSVNNFYPPPHDDPKMKTGTFCVAAASRYGRGRVVAWGDSTVFSNFEIFKPGKYEFLLNSMNWLNHKDSSLAGVLRRILPMALGLALAAFLLRRRDPRLWLGSAVVMVAAWFVARAVSEWQEREQAVFPEPVQAADWVAFAAHLEDPGHHLTEFVPGEPYNTRYDLRYEVFIQWVMRTGAFPGFYLLGPEHREGLYEHLREAKAVRTASALIVRQPEDLPQLKELATAQGADQTPLLLLFASSISIEQATEALRGSGILEAPESLAQVAKAWPTGEAIIESEGRRLLIIAGAERFSDQKMGISEKVKPNAQQRALFDQSFGIIERLFTAPAKTPADAPDGN